MQRRLKYVHGHRALAVLASILMSACSSDALSQGRHAAGQNSPPAHSDPIIAAAGDIACDPSQRRAEGEGNCEDSETAKLLATQNLTAVLPLGDLQYEDGTLAQFMGGYEKTWGKWKAITHPAVGNHEYQTQDAAGYFNYFGEAVGNSSGYYSYDIGSWHLISLNGNCGVIGGCMAGSAQELWLKDDLATHHAACTLAYWHQPRFSSGPHNNDVSYAALWWDLYLAHADIVLNGHDHDYERFALQDPNGKSDPARGIREFVVGTGGRSHYAFTRVANNSEVRNNETYGILALTLHASSYDWKFIPIPGVTFSDSGSGLCHG